MNTRKMKKQIKDAFDREKKAKTKERPAIIGEIVGRIIVFGLTFCILVAVFALVILTAYGFVMLMKGLFNG